MPSLPVDMTRDQRREWRDVVLASLELTAAQKVVLLALETFADYPAGTNARPGIELLAKKSGLQDRAVRGALTRGQALGIINQTSRANPKAGRAAVYRLLPQRVSTGTTAPVEKGVSTGAAVPVEEAGQDGFQPARNGFQPARNEFQPARIDISTGTAVPPTNPVPIQVHQSINTESRALARAPRAHVHARGENHNDLCSMPEDEKVDDALRTSSPEKSEELTIVDAEPMCVGCEKEPANPFCAGLCIGCHDDEQTHQRNGSTFEADFDTPIKELFNYG